MFKVCRIHHTTRDQVVCIQMKDRFFTNQKGRNIFAVLQDSIIYYDN